MKRSEMVKLIHNTIDGFSNSDDSGNGFKCAELVLNNIEKKGMFPPQLPKETMEYYALNYGLHWEDSFPIPKKNDIKELKDE